MPVISGRLPGVCASVRPLSRIMLLLAPLLLLACAPVPFMQYDALTAYVHTGDYPGALSYLQSSRDAYGVNQQLIYHMDAGMLHMLNGDYLKSIDDLQEASHLAESLWTRSLSREAAAFAFNDYLIPYAGEDFEKVMINMLLALDYSMLGQRDEALVEARRINSLLGEYNDTYGENKNRYVEDAFARYLSGLLYTSGDRRDLQNLDSAFIDMHRAYSAYQQYGELYGTPMPRVFVDDYLRVAQGAGRLQETAGLLNSPDSPGVISLYDEQRDYGRIVLVHFNGRGPLKVEDAIFIERVNMVPIKLAFPRFEVATPFCRTSALHAKLTDRMHTSNDQAEHDEANHDQAENGLPENDQTETVQTDSHEADYYMQQSELVEDINAIAVKNLEDRRGRIILKAIARAVIKQSVVKAVEDTQKSDFGKGLARLTGDLMALASEVADTRSWRTLPGEIRLARTYVPPGEYDISISRCAEQRKLTTLSVKAGETRFVLYESMH